MTKLVLIHFLHLGWVERLLVTRVLGVKLFQGKLDLDGRNRARVADLVETLLEGLVLVDDVDAVHFVDLMKSRDPALHDLCQLHHLRDSVARPRKEYEIFLQLVEHNGRTRYICGYTPMCSAPYLRVILRVLLPLWLQYAAVLV